MTQEEPAAASCQQQHAAPQTGSSIASLAALDDAAGDQTNAQQPSPQLELQQQQQQQYESLRAVALRMRLEMPLKER